MLRLLAADRTQTAQGAGLGVPLLDHQHEEKQVALASDLATGWRTISRSGDHRDLHPDLLGHNQPCRD